MGGVWSVGWRGLARLDCWRMADLVPGRRRLPLIRLAARSSLWDRARGRTERDCRDFCPGEPTRRVETHCISSFPSFPGVLVTALWTAGAGACDRAARGVVVAAGFASLFFFLGTGGLDPSQVELVGEEDDSSSSAESLEEDESSSSSACPLGMGFGMGFGFGLGIRARRGVLRLRALARMEREGWRRTGEASVAFFLLS